MRKIYLYILISSFAFGTSLNNYFGNIILNSRDCSEITNSEECYDMGCEWDDEEGCYRGDDNWDENENEDDCFSDCEGIENLDEYNNADEVCDWLISVSQSECFYDCDDDFLEELNFIVELCYECLNTDNYDCSFVFDEEDEEGEEEQEGEIDCMVLEEEDCRDVEYCEWTDSGCLFVDEDDDDGADWECEDLGYEDCMYFDFCEWLSNSPGGLDGICIDAGEGDGGGDDGNADDGGTGGDDGGDWECEDLGYEDCMYFDFCEWLSNSPGGLDGICIDAEMLDSCGDLSQDECIENEDCEWAIITNPNGVFEMCIENGDMNDDGGWEDCDPDLSCATVLTCVDGLLYPTSCGPDNCDDPIGECEDDDEGPPECVQDCPGIEDVSPEEDGTYFCLWLLEVFPTGCAEDCEQETLDFIEEAMMICDECLPVDECDGAFGNDDGGDGGDDGGNVEVALIIGEVSAANSNQLVEVPLYYESSVPLGGIQFTISDSPDWVEGVEIASNIDDCFQVNSNDVNGDLIGIVFSLEGCSLDASDVASHLVTIYYELSSDAEWGSYIDLSFEEAIIADPEGMSLGVATYGGGITVSLLGDVNSDGSINVLDVVSLINYILLFEEANDYEFWVSDVNGDNSLDVLDVVLLVGWILD